MFSIRIPMHDKQGNNPFEADATGAIIAFLSIFAFIPSVVMFGFAIQTWLFLAIFAVSLVHFVTFFFGEIYRNIVKPDILAQREKAKAEGEQS